MSAKSLYKDANDSDSSSQQEWGIYPSQRSGRSSIVAPVSDQRPAVSSRTTDSSARHCRYCTETLPPGARECPLCLRAVTDPAAERRAMLSETQTITGPLTLNGSRAPVNVPIVAAPTNDAPTTLPVQATATGGAVYTLESPARCPECDAEISTINILRGLRTQVSFTSTLPRKAYVMACPSCRKILSAGLSGLL